MINQDYRAGSRPAPVKRPYKQMIGALVPSCRKMRFTAFAGIALIITGFSTLPGPSDDEHLKLVKELPLQELTQTPQHAEFNDSHDTLDTSIVVSSPNESVKIPQLSQEMLVRSGDSLARLFQQADLDPGELHQIMQFEDSAVLRSIHPGDRIAYATDPSGKLAALTYAIDDLSTLYVSRNGDTFNAQTITKPLDIRQAYGQATIDSSLYQAGKEAGLSDRLIMELAGIFQWDIDFILDIRKGDHFSVIFEEKYVNGDKIGLGNIVAATFTSQDKLYTAIRYTDSQGRTSYYNPEGESMRKAFLRAPLNFSRVSANFNPRRRHPILNKIRAHKGVDYAAATGTPVRASGDGKVKFAGRKGGYGKVIILSHGQTYQSRYAHLSRYAKNIRSGTRVKQGQIIGYVGSTGLATGPHLHYEFLVNGVHRNPRTIALPNAKPIPKNELARFEEKTADLRVQLNVRERLRLAQFTAER